MSRLLTTGEVVRDYGRTRYYWRKQARSGRIPHILDPDNKRLYFLDHDIESFLRRFTMTRSQSIATAASLRRAVQRISRES